MYQQEIQFFWPLTEQIPLDLDYSDCVRPKLTVANTSFGTGLTTSTFPTGTSWLAVNAAFRLQENTTTMLVAKKPNLLRKLLFKLLGFKWEIN